MPPRPDELIRVLLAVSRLDRGGLEQVLLDVARGLSDRGFQFRIVALRGPGRRDREFQDAGIPVQVLDGRASLSPRDVWANLRCILGLRAALESWRPHILQTHHFFSGTIGRLAGWAAGAPALLQAEHNFYLWKGRLARGIDRVLASRTARFVVPSQAVAGHVQQTHGVPESQVTVVWNGLAPPPFLPREEARQALGLAADRPIVGMVSRLVPSKQPELFVRLAAALAAGAASGVEAPLCVLLGAGLLEESCRGLAARLGLDDRHLRLLGEVPAAARFLLALDLLVSCSGEEGFGLAVSEAVLAGVPVVVPDLPAFREILPNRAAERFVVPGDPVTLTRAVQQTLADLPAARAGAAGDRAWLEPRVSLAAMLDGYERLYRTLVARGVEPGATGLRVDS